jgi:hypothetical protein
MTPTGFTSPEAYEHHIFKYIHIQQGKWIDEQSRNRREYERKLAYTTMLNRKAWSYRHPEQHPPFNGEQIT